MNAKDRIKAVVAALDRKARPWAERSRLNAALYEFLLFGLKQAWACLFGAIMLALLLGTQLWWPEDAALSRYDFLVIAAIAVQAAMLALKLERWDEAVVILVFHVVGTAMEVFKTAHGSWIYPGEGVLHIGGVPLFSGFMYAAIGSYIARIMRLFDVRFVRYPPAAATWALALLAYVNFFTHTWLPDIRIGLYVFSVVLFARTQFYFTADRVPRPMPMVIGLVLVALFIWFAENLGTFAAAWVYPDQADGWRLVSMQKIGAWYLLILLSFVLVTLVHRPRKLEAPHITAARSAGAVRAARETDAA